LLHEFFRVGAEILKNSALEAKALRSSPERLQQQPHRTVHFRQRLEHRQDAQVLRRARTLIRRRRPTTDPARMAVVRAAICRRTTFGSALENLYVPRAPPGAAIGVVVGDVALHRPGIAGADAEFKAERPGIRGRR
jgi:hypothetical protein